MNKHMMTVAVAIIGCMSAGSALAWKCGQRCPSSIFSGKLECEAYQLGCVEDGKNTFGDTHFGGMSAEDQQKEKEAKERAEQEAREKANAATEASSGLIAVNENDAKWGEVTSARFTGNAASLYRDLLGKGEVPIPDSISKIDCSVNSFGLSAPGAKVYVAKICCIDIGCMEESAKDNTLSAYSKAEANMYAKLRSKVEGIAKSEVEKQAVLKREEEMKKQKEMEQQDEVQRVAERNKQKSNTDQNSRYYIYDNGTVLDARTNLMWKRCTEGQRGLNCKGGIFEEYKWDEAMSKFKGMNSYAGYDDWRIPTIDELRTLIYCSNGAVAKNFSGCDGKAGTVGGFQQPAIDIMAFPNTPDIWFWSSSNDYAPNRRLISSVLFTNSFSSFYDKDFFGSIRLVRNAN